MSYWFRKAQCCKSDCHCTSANCSRIKYSISAISFCKARFQGHLRQHPYYHFWFLAKIIAQMYIDLSHCSFFFNFEFGHIMGQKSFAGNFFVSWNYESIIMRWIFFDFFDMFLKAKCRECRRKGVLEKLIVCIRCYRCYHIDCIKPKLSRVGFIKIIFTEITILHADFSAFLYNTKMLSYNTFFQVFENWLCSNCSSFKKIGETEQGKNKRKIVSRKRIFISFFRINSWNFWKF